MRAEFRFYAELNDFITPEKRFRTFAYTFDVSGSVKDAIEGLGIPHTEVDLIIVNGQSVDFSYQVRHGDRIAVYPVFESIDISPELRVRAQPLREPRFVLDIHLGRLANYLRMLGFDTLYQNDFQDQELSRISKGEKRILLTRDRDLLKRCEIVHGYFVRSTGARRQLIEILRRFDLLGAIAPFTRCLRCNSLLEPVAKQTIERDLPPRTRERYGEFESCATCGRIYWKGSHYERMLRFVEELKAARDSE